MCSEVCTDWKPTRTGTWVAIAEKTALDCSKKSLWAISGGKAESFGENPSGRRFRKLKNSSNFSRIQSFPECCKLEKAPQLTGITRVVVGAASGKQASVACLRETAAAPGRELRLVSTADN